MHKLFNISFILVVRPTDKVVGLPKRGRGNEKGNHSVDVINLLKSIWYLCLPISYIFLREFVPRINFCSPFPWLYDRTISIIFSRNIWLFSWHPGVHVKYWVLLQHRLEKYCLILFDLMIFWWHLEEISDKPSCFTFTSQAKAKIRKGFVKKRCCSNIETINIFV